MSLGPQRPEWAACAGRVGPHAGRLSSRALRLMLPTTVSEYPSLIACVGLPGSGKSTEEVFKRLRHDQNRPLLQVADPLGRLRELYQARDPLYRETAHFVIETGRPSVASLVNMIIMQLELAGLGRGAAVAESSPAPAGPNH